MSRTKFASAALSSRSVAQETHSNGIDHGPHETTGAGVLTSDYSHLGQLFDLSPDLLALASFQPLRWIRVNPAFRSVLGWAEHELIGTRLAEIVHPGDRERLESIEAILHEQGSVDLEVRLLCKTGGNRSTSWRIALDQAGESLLFTGRDVTQSKRTIKHLRSKQHRIERENESLEQFVRTAGHDLQEPLRTLSMYSELLMRNYGREMPDSSVDLLLQIFGAATRMHALVSDLLVYARASESVAILNDDAKAVSLERVLEEVTKGLKSAIEESSAIVSHDVLPHVRGDETQLVQLLQNLISNSLKYRRDSAPLHIHIGAEKSLDEWLFTVADNGTGFEPGDAERIFLDFKRLHGREIPGTGLGLAICRRIVQRHGGRIWATARPGEGATFCFTLPAVDE